MSTEPITPAVYHQWWSEGNRTTSRAWFEVYADLRAEGKEYYFDNANGFARCRDEALAGVPRAQEVWAMYVAKRMTG